MMQSNIFGMKEKNPDIAWCPGCGNFGLRTAMLEVFSELELAREDVVFVSGIGQAAKAPQYYDGNFFNGLHGRSLPTATGIKAANPNLTVIVESGDGDMYGEGGNHFIHAIRRNPNITLITHNNLVYGLTKGQASPTSQIGMETPVQVNGVFETPINPLTLAISLDCSFVARSSVHEKELTKDIVKKAIEHPGFALVDIFQSCVTFNKINTPKWFKENTYIVEEFHDPTDKKEAFSLALSEGPWPLGVLYVSPNKVSFENHQRLYEADKSPLFMRKTSEGALDSLLEQYR